VRGGARHRQVARDGDGGAGISNCHGGPGRGHTREWGRYDSYAYGGAAAVQGYVEVGESLCDAASGGILSPPLSLVRGVFFRNYPMLFNMKVCGLRADSVTETDQIDFQVPSASNRLVIFG